MSNQRYRSRAHRALVPLLCFAILAAGLMALKKLFAQRFEPLTQLALHQCYNLFIAAGVVITSRLVIARIWSNRENPPIASKRAQYGFDLFGAGYAGFHIGVWWIMFRHLSERLRE